MKLCTRCACDKATEEFSRNPRRSDGLSSWCRACTSEYNRAYNAARPKQAAARVAEWRKTHPDARQREYARNAETIKARAKSWLLSNPAKRRMLWANYRAARLRATPAWADKRAISLVYVECALRNAQHGANSYHVDHIIPLKNPLVCGLHVADNLRVVPAIVNMTKSNKLDTSI